MRRKTNDEFLNNFQQIKTSEDIEILDEYVNRFTHVRCQCKKCNHIWSCTPANLLKGKGCPKCKGFYRTHEEFLQIINEINPNITILSEYKFARCKIKCRCKIDDYEWETTADALMRGSGCRKCSDIKKNFEKQKTQFEFESEVRLKNDSISNGKVKIVSKYIGDKKEIECLCIVCDYEYTTSPRSLLQGAGCPRCAGNCKKTHEQFITELGVENNTIEITGEYNGANKNIPCKCLKCNYEWSPKSFDLLRRGLNCPRCNGRIRTHEDFINDMNDAHPDIIVVDKYINANTKIKFKCKVCDDEWHRTPPSAIKSNGCPTCNTSKGEKKCIEWLKTRNIDFTRQHTFNDLSGDVDLLRFDFAIYINKILYKLLEYDGIFHFKEVYEGHDLEKQQKYDKMKNEYCTQNNIQLLRIPYWEYDNIESILTNEFNDIT